MKKLLLLSALLLCSVLSFAFEVDGIAYNVTSEKNLTVEVAKKTDYAGDIVIPEKVTYEEKEYSVTSIEKSAFSGCTRLTSVTIPNSVTTIGWGTFYGCYDLTSVTIPNSVIRIGDYAFAGCRRLTSVTIPNSVIKIGNNAFSGCDGLTSMTIPNSVTSIGDYAFSGCSGLTSLTIPNSVTNIGVDAFSGCSGLTSLTIPNSVTSIGGGAFSGCSGLTSVTIPSSVTSIGRSAFNGCSGLTSLTIPNSVTNIGIMAFYGCSGLTSVTIPNSVTSIGGGAFSGCSGIKVESGNKNYDSRNNCNAVIETSTNTLIAGCKNTVIPNSVTSIGDNAFSGCSGLTSVTIPSSVTSIGDIAFSGCSGLTSVTIPNSVTSIGGGAFQNCSGLTSVTIPGSVTSIEACTFQFCSGLTSVTIPSSVTSIGRGAFNGCSGLTSLTIPNSVTNIEIMAFYGCSGLTSVNIPNSVTSIGDRAFLGCSALTSLAIPNSVTSIGDYAFASCSGLTSVTIPNSVTTIGQGAFCASTSSQGLICMGMTSVTIPNSVTSIGDYAFWGCSSLTEIYSMISEPFETKTSCWSYVNKDIPLYVPIGSKAKYQQTSGWKEFTNIIELDVSTDNTLAMDNLTGYVGKTVTLPILLNNEQQITGLQFDLVLPAGVTVAQKANGKNDITVTERMEEGYSLSSNTTSDGNMRVTGLSMESTPFTGNSDAIINVVLQIDESVAEGDYPIQVKNIVLSDVNGVAHKPITASCLLTVKSYILGDVDDSGDININDAVCIVNYILNKPNAKFIVEAADLDGSGDININDAVVLINKYILKKTNAKAMKAPRRAATGSENYLSIDAISIKPGETKTVSVDMTNTESIQGLQCNIDLPEGLSFATKSNGKVDIANDADRGDGFTLSGNMQEDGSLTVATVNFEGDTYYGNTGTIFTFKITADESMAAGEYEIKVRDIVLSCGVAIKPSDTTGKVTVSNSETGLQQIEANGNQSNRIYNLNGQRVKTPKQGIYIKNGRKVLTPF